MGLHVGPTGGGGSGLIEVTGETNDPTPRIVEPIYGPEAHTLFGGAANRQGGSWEYATALVSQDVATNYGRIPLDNCRLEVALGAGPTTSADWAFDEADIDAYTDGIITNALPIRFPIAGDNWFTGANEKVYSWFITDTDDLASLGNVSLYGNVNQATEISNQDRAIFNDGAISITIQ
jgi:hypothetical protein